MEGSVDAGHAPAEAELQVEFFAGPDGDMTSGKRFPGGGSGEFPEDGIQELTVIQAGYPRAVGALTVQQAAQGGEQRLDQAPLVVGEGGGLNSCVFFVRLEERISRRQVVW